ncbi:nuclear transport factor 2 family protein [Trujillonella humicola]|uniref:nuclear transport factor 2 family protein n=1 Tax=Trujillonella humicola TaxID=3383699 RepID=UPI003905C12D
MPSPVPPEHVRGVVARYYASFTDGDLAGREALFAPSLRFEDPAGRVVATDSASLHTFFTEVLPASWSLGFRLERVTVVAGEAVATTTMRLAVPDRVPVEVVVNAHFVLDGTGLITSVRVFFDEEAMRDAP